MVKGNGRFVSMGAKHRTWRKIHLTGDESTREIESCAMTTNSIDDAAMVGFLLAQIEGRIKKGTATVLCMVE